MTPSALKLRRRVTHTLRTFPAILLIAGLGLLPAGAASAGGLPSPHELHHDVRDAVSDLFRSLSHVPVSIHLQTRHLDAFFGGHEYYAPHRHSHATYRFPVWIDNDVQYRPYSYCNGQLFGYHSARPRLWVEWGTLSSGHYCDRCHGYFPARHGHFRTYNRYHHRYEDRYRYYRHRKPTYHRHDRHCGHYQYDRHRDRHRGHHRDRRWDHRRHDRHDHDARRGHDRGHRHDRDARDGRRGRHDDRDRDGRRGRSNRRGHRGGP